MTMIRMNPVQSIWITLTVLLAVSHTGLAAESQTRRERAAAAMLQASKYMEMKKAGVDAVSHTKESAAMRDYQLRHKKRKGLFRKRPASLASILFPGVSPENYVTDEPIWAITDVVHSKKAPLPYDFYDLPGCPKPQGNDWKKNLKQRRNLGVRLQGNELMPAPFPFRIMAPRSCTPLCKVTIGPKKMKWLKKLIDRKYRVEMSLDHLPLLLRSQKSNSAVRGYPIGVAAYPNGIAAYPGGIAAKGGKVKDYFLFNHLKFTITVHQDPESFDGVRITGFDVKPASIKHEFGKENKAAITDKTQIRTCNADNAKPIANDPTKYLKLEMDGKSDEFEILYSYEVDWVTADLPWADRWDVYFIDTADDSIHFFALLNSLMIVMFLSGSIAVIMVRILRQDLASYNELPTLEDKKEEFGWKLVHGDVFRPPKTYPMALCVMAGTGAQIGSACLLTLLCAMLKLLNPMKKGANLTAILILYVLSGFASGYVSSRLYKFFNGTNWKLNTVATAVALPGSFVSVFAVLNVFLTIAGTSAAVSVLTILALFGMWMCISTPLVFMGSYFGFRAERLSVPTKTNQIERILPELPKFIAPPYSFFLGGILPFGSVCIEAFFVMGALWLHQIYYVMSFLLAILLILTITSAEVSVVMTYMQLCTEDHRWWWKSFWNCATSGVYMFLYSIYFLVGRLQLVGFLPVLVYLTYMSMISVCFGLFCGSVGVITSFWFTTKIYGALKVD